jgi:magnesium transporter
MRSVRPAAPPPQQPVSHATVDCAIYVDGERLPGEVDHQVAYRKVKELRERGREAFVWVGLHEPDDHQMQAVAEVFGLHPLAVEDAVHAHQRPKLERYDDTLFLVLKTVTYIPHESVVRTREIVETGEILTFVAPGFVVTVRHGDHSGLSGVRRDLEERTEQLKLGPFAVLHAIADQVVDNYRDVTTLMERDIDAIEQDTFSPRSRTDITHIYLLKREVVEFRRAVEPLSPALHRLQTDHTDLISTEVLRYLGDVLDHQTQAAERITSYDTLLSSLVQAALAKVGMQQNIDMRKITAWVAIVSVPTMLAGIYGMNFEHMPELGTVWGYPAVLLVMLTACVLLYRNFRRNNWL